MGLKPLHTWTLHPIMPWISYCVEFKQVDPWPCPRSKPVYQSIRPVLAPVPWSAVIWLPIRFSHKDENLMSFSFLPTEPNASMLQHRIVCKIGTPFQRIVRLMPTLSHLPWLAIIFYIVKSWKWIWSSCIAFCSENLQDRELFCEWFLFLQRCLKTLCTYRGVEICWFKPCSIFSSSKLNVAAKFRCRSRMVQWPPLFRSGRPRSSQFSLQNRRALLLPLVSAFLLRFRKIRWHFPHF